jgi:hypothetical protein
MAGAKNLTGVECRQIEAAIRNVMRRNRVALAESMLEHDLAEAEWLGGFDGDVLFSKAWEEPTRTRTIEAATIVLRLKRVAWALTVASRLRGFKQRLRALRELRIRSGAPQGDLADEAARAQAWDLLFEIELAAQLARKPLLVTFEEPDVVVSRPDGSSRLGLACKRPRRLVSVPGAVGDAVRQVAESGDLGMVVLSLDLIVGQHAGAPRNWIIVKHDRETPAACDRVVGAAMQDLAGRIGSVFHRASERAPHEMSRVGGVLGVANLAVIAGLDGGGTYMNTKTVTSMLPLMDAKGSADVLAGIQEILALGQAEFRSDEWLRGLDKPAA